jgi:hypothetical protein
MQSDRDERRLQRERERFTRLMGEVATCEQAARLLRTVSLRTSTDPAAIEQTIRGLEALARRLKRDKGVLG